MVDLVVAEEAGSDEVAVAWEVVAWEVVAWVVVAWVVVAWGVVAWADKVIGPHMGPQDNMVLAESYTLPWIPYNPVVVVDFLITMF